MVTKFNDLGSSYNKSDSTYCYDNIIVTNNFVEDKEGSNK